MKDDLSVLTDNQGNRVTDDHVKAEILRDYFERQCDDSPRPADLSAILCPLEVPVLNDVDTYCSKTSGSPEGLPALFFRRAALGLATPLSTESTLFIFLCSSKKRGLPRYISRAIELTPGINAPCL